jgi:cytochrome b561
MLRNTLAGWGSAAKLFHWVGAVVVVFLIVFGWWMTHAAERSGRFSLYQLHSVVGYYLLLLIVLRVLWRAVNPTPVLPADTKPWERIAAHLSHGLLYLFMFAISLTGWVMVGVGRRPIEATLFGFLHVPLASRTPDRALHDLLEDSHRAMAYMLLALTIIHVAAALRHHFIKKNDVLRRMGWVKQSLRVEAGS